MTVSGWRPLARVLALISILTGLIGLPPALVQAATPSFIQVNAAVPQSTSVSTVTVKYNAAQTAGNLNVVIVGWNDLNASVTSVTDSSGNTYTRAIGPTKGTGLSQSIYYATPIVAAAAAANTVSVVFSQGAVYPDVRVLEYSGIDSTTPIDGVAGNKGSSATSSSGNLTTTNANDLLVGGNVVANATNGAGTGFTNRIITWPNSDIAEDRIVTATGTYSATAPVDSGPWVMQMVAFRAAGGAPPPPAPGAPTGLAATATSTSQINLTWSAPTTGGSVTGYRVERCQGAACSNFAQIATPSTTTFADTGLTASTAYSYRVLASGPGGVSGFSNTASATTQAPAPPGAPTNLDASATSVSQIDLTWTAATGTVTNYRLERCQGASCNNFAQFATSTGTTYSDTGLNASTSYSYRLLASGPGGTSGYSNVDTAITLAPTPPTAPTNLNATAVSASQINLSWTASTGGGGVTGYQLERCQGAGCSNFGPLATPPGTTYSDTGLTASTSYSYRVRASSPGGPSGYSNTDSETTQAATPPSTGNPTFVQVNAAVPQSTSVSTVTVKYNAVQTGGNLNVVIVGWNDVGAAVASVTDTSGNVYLRAIGPTQGAGVSQSIYYSAPIFQAAAGVNTVTVTFSQGAVYPDVRILEYSGIDSVVPVDGAVGSSGGGSTSNSGNLVTTNANDLLVAGNVVTSSTGGPGAGFTQRIITNPDGDIAEDRVVTALGSYSATAPIDAGSWVMQMVAFRAGGSAPPPPSPPTVSITAPTAGSVVVGNVQVGAVAAGFAPIAGVQFKVDGANVGAEDTSAPYSITWDSTGVTPGANHSLTAVARDADGRTTTSAAVSVRVESGAGIGFWESPVNLPIISVHTVLLPNGKVMMFDGQDSGVLSRIWDTAANTFQLINLPINFFCAGLTSLADGRLFEAGGHDGNAHVGLPDTKIFNQSTLQWSSGPTMADRRWYPTTTTLGDGRVLILAGESNCDQCNVLRPEIYDPATNSLLQLTGAEKNFSYYPHTFVLQDGRVLVTSTAEYPTVSQVLDINTRTWTAVGSTALEGGTAVQYAPGKFLKTGRSTDPDKAVRSSSALTYVLDMNQPNPNWRQVASMASPRTYATSLMLPDGNVFVEGGGRDTAAIDPTNAVYSAEIWSPSTETWTTVASASTPRLYHSTALLMPDGRVMVSGGGRFDNGTAPTDRFSAEFYQPPYLFKGARPTITSAPSNLHYNTGFQVQTPDASQISSVTLIRLGSVTHAFDMSQHYVPASFTKGAGTLTVQAPANGNVAPPGYYMLFIVNSNGVPSVAPIVQLT